MCTQFYQIALTALALLGSSILTAGAQIFPVSFDSTEMAGLTPSDWPPAPADQAVVPIVEPSDETFLADVAWRKGEYRIVPYGIGWLNMAYDTSRTATGPFVLFVESPDVQGEPSFSINARATRLGLDFTGPVILGAKSGGNVEIDFHGQAVTENRTGTLLRHAYGEFKTDEWRFLGGQTWDVISPLNPNVLNYTVGWAGGNPGYRRAQVRIERFFELSGDGQLTFQSSLNRSIVTDFVDDPLVGGEDAGWPTLEGRVAYTERLPELDSRFEFGLSGHIGQEGVDFRTAPVQDDARFLSWSFNADLYAPLTDRCGFQGEFFVGEVLGTYLAGINQGIDPVKREGIRSIGGWGEVWWNWTDQLHSHAGFGIDDPDNSDLSAGRRSLNRFFFTNLIWNVTSMFEVGLEVSQWKTKYVGLSDGDAVRIESVMRYRF